MFSTIRLAPRVSANTVAAFASKRYASTASYEMIKVSTVGANENVGLIELYRPKALNAFCTPLMDELNVALKVS